MAVLSTLFSLATYLAVYPKSFQTYVLYFICTVHYLLPVSYLLINYQQNVRKIAFSKFSPSQIYVLFDRPPLQTCYAVRLAQNDATSHVTVCRALEVSQYRQFYVWSDRRPVGQLERLSGYATVLCALACCLGNLTASDVIPRFVASDGVCLG